MIANKNTLYQGKYLTLVQQENWEYVERANCTDVVVILALTPDHNLIMVEQYRIPIAANLIEWPAGLVNDIPGHPPETIEDAAARELFEETGYQARHYQKVISGPVSAGLSTESITFVQAVDIWRAGEGGGDGNESIITHEVPLHHVDQWLSDQIKAGKTIDIKIYSGLYLLSHPRNQGC